MKISASKVLASKDITIYIHMSHGSESPTRPFEKHTPLLRLNDTTPDQATSCAALPVLRVVGRCPRSPQQCQTSCQLINQLILPKALRKQRVCFGFIVKKTHLHQLHVVQHHHSSIPPFIHLAAPSRAAARSFHCRPSFELGSSGTHAQCQSVR